MNLRFLGNPARWAFLAALPMISTAAVPAGEFVTVPDGRNQWTMLISPRRPAGGSIEDQADSLRLASFEGREEAVGLVPEPIELIRRIDDPPADSGVPDSPLAGNESMPSPLPMGGLVDPAAYWCVYRTIPFLRTEYLANPSYRHEATMEFLFGQLRPTVVHKTERPLYQPSLTTPPNVGPPAGPANIPPYVYDIYQGQIPTFIQRYQPPTIPFGYPVHY